MGRSVSYATGSEVVLYTHFEPSDYNDEYLCQIEFNDIIEDLKSYLKVKFNSLYDSNEWLGREDRAIVENDLAYIGISEYCDIVSVWVKPKDENYNLGVNWANSIRKSLGDIVKNSFGIRLVKQGNFSDGTSVYGKV